jgi:hypothetical protein
MFSFWLLSHRWLLGLANGPGPREIRFGGASLRKELEASRDEDMARVGVKKSRGNGDKKAGSTRKNKRPHRERARAQNRNLAAPLK